MRNLNIRRWSTPPIIGAGIFVATAVLIMGCHPGVETSAPEQIPFRSDIVVQMDDVTADFILTPLHDVFNLKQLTWLQVHRHQLSDAINAEIRGDSTLAIQMAVYLRMETAIGVLREKSLTLRSPYMWEGPDYSTEEPFMSENQYPYHCIYIWAIVGIAQAPLSEVIKLTDAERATLEAKAAGTRPFNSFPSLTNDKWVDGQTWCAKWLLTQLVPDKKGTDQQSSDAAERIACPP